MADNPCFKLELHLTYTGDRVRVENPTLLTDEIMDRAWFLLSDFVMDVVDELGLEPTDEHFRSLLMEICYRLIYREMTTLNLLPIREKHWRDRLGTRKRGVRVEKRGPYETSW